MVVMNTLGISITNNDADRLGQRTACVQVPPTLPQPSYAEQVIGGETTSVTTWSNDPALRFLRDRQEMAGARMSMAGDR
jgi:hypothetical protein